MFHNIYHMYPDIKIMENIESTNKPTSNQAQDTPTTEYPLENLNQFLLIPLMYNYDHLWFGIAMHLYFTQMVYGNVLFAHKSGGNFQGYVAVKLVIV